MKVFLQILLAFLLIISSGNVAAGIYSDKTINKALRFVGKTWSEHENRNTDAIEIEPLVSTPESAHYSSRDTLFSIVIGSSEPFGFLVISSAKGRFDFFDFMMVYNMERELVDIRILTYRSEHGSQITSRTWLRQFCELNSSTIIQYGIEVDALSGATFSANSLTTQVNRINKLMLERP